MGGALFEGCDFSYATLFGLRFKKKDIVNMNFTGAKLNDCVFVESHMYSCRFTKAIFNNVSFEKSDVRSVDFEGSNLTACKLSDTVISLAQAVMIAESFGAICEDV